jgi:pimeloyl-ACP methyl ester carboxylesterase
MSEAGKAGASSAWGEVGESSWVTAQFRPARESIKAFSETDFTEDLKKIDVPTLVMHGEDDQIVPVKTPPKSRPSSLKAPRKYTIQAPPTASRPRIKIRSMPIYWPSSKRNAMQGRRLLDVRFSSKDLAHY